MKRGRYKIFRDNVHGYIKVPLDIVRMFVDTETFQRLRYIEQTGMRTLFPSARHDRFIHSLGTYHLGQKAFQSFRANVKRLSLDQSDPERQHYNVVKGDEVKSTVFWDKCEVLFQIACLLHDCGHAPFSHTLEFVYEYPSNIVKDRLKQFYTSYEFETDFVNHGSPHEKMSALVVGAEYAEKIECLLEKYNLKTSFENGDDIEFVARMIIGCHYGCDNRINRIKNCLISLLNSRSFDVDSLDYIIRDAKLSGIDSMSVDVDRLLGSLTLVEKTVFTNQRFRKALINTNVMNGVFIGKSGGRVSITGQYRGMARINSFEGTFEGSISVSGNARIMDGAEFKPAENNILKIGGVSYTHSNIVPSTGNMADINLFGITESCLKMSGSSIKFGKEFNGQIKLCSDRVEVVSAFIQGNIDGMFSGELLGYYCNLGGDLTCELGYYKSSLSVIQNVLFARNYEYQWIYSHHKVTYYSNYLIIELLRLCIKYILKRNGKDESEYDEVLANILSWKDMIKSDDDEYIPYDFWGELFLMPVDDDITAIFKKCRILCITDKDIHSKCSQLLEEYYTRNYKKSLWKSFAEYNIFFSGFSDSEKSKLYNLVVTCSKDKVIDQFGYFNDEWEQAFYKCGMQNVVWVNAGSKPKVLNPDSTYILFANATLNLRTAMMEDNTIVDPQFNFFYMYYEEVVDEKTDTIISVDLEKIKLFIQDKLKTFM